MTTRRMALLSMASVAVLAGCGSSKSGSSKSGTSPASYRAQVNKICANNNAQITALPTSDRNTVAGLKKEEAITTTALNQIKGISPPSSMSTGVNSWLAVIEQEETDASEAVTDLQTGKTSAAQSIAAKGSALDTQGNSDAKSLGVASCAVDTEPSGK